jgi:Flp pilus assembly protein TadD
LEPEDSVKRFAVALAAVALLGALPVAGHAADKKKADKSADAAPTAMPGVTDSLGMLERVVAKDSTKFDNLQRLGVMLMDRDRNQEAARVLTKAVTLKPRDTHALVNLGAAYDALGQQDAAQAYYRDALKSAPEDSVATCRLASSLYAASKTGEAMDLLRKVIQEKPGSYCAYFTLGVAFADAGIYRDAIRMWKKVVALAPSSPEAISANESIEVL